MIKIKIEFIDKIIKLSFTFAAIFTLYSRNLGDIKVMQNLGAQKIIKEYLSILRDFQGRPTKVLIIHA